MDKVRPKHTVSVVIPTRGRPALVLAAVRSALAQSSPPHEVIVVVDGPHEVGRNGNTYPDSAASLTAINDGRLRVLVQEHALGGAEARNVGVRAASGDWIAFLDDDDLWLRDKLREQLRWLAYVPIRKTPVLSCSVIARGTDWEETWPRVAYEQGQPMAEYLFCRRGWRYGEALLQTSTLLAPRELLLQVPFTANLRKHQDWDWLLRVSEVPSVEIYPVAGEPMVVFHVEGDRPSTGRVRDWRFSLQWARTLEHCFTPRAFLGFLATECAAQAQDASPRERLGLLATVFKAGLPGPRNLLRLFVFLGVSQRTRRAIRDGLRRTQGHPQPASLEIGS